MNLTFTISVHSHPCRRLPLVSQTRAPRTFVRTRRQNGQESLETSSITFCDVNNNRITLHSMIHFADPAYYKIPSHQETLYELLVPHSLTTPHSSLAKLRTPIQASSQARAVAKALGVTAQSDALDYTSGWIADASLEEVQALRKWDWPRVNAEQIVALVLPAPELFYYLAEMPQLNVISLWAALGRLDWVGLRRAAFMRRAERTCKEKTYSAGNREDMLREDIVVQGILEKLQSVEDIGVVYGAWHMGRLCRRLEDQLGLRFAKVEWRRAMSVSLEGGWGVVVVILWLVVGGADWVDVWMEGDWTWYFVRHFCMAVALRRWLGIGEER